MVESGYNKGEVHDRIASDRLSVIAIITVGIALGGVGRARMMVSDPMFQSTNKRIDIIEQRLWEIGVLVVELMTLGVMGVLKSSGGGPGGG